MLQQQTRTLRNPAEMVFRHKFGPAHLWVALYRLQSIYLVPCPLLKGGAANTCKRLFAIPQSLSPCLFTYLHGKAHP